MRSLTISKKRNAVIYSAPSTVAFKFARFKSLQLWGILQDSGGASYGAKGLKPPPPRFCSSPQIFV